MCKWKSEYQPDYECTETPLSNDPRVYCILHSDEKKDMGQFTDKVKERITKGTLTPSGWEIDKIDLGGCYFPRGFEARFFQERRFEKPVDFSEATFTEGANFSWATFTEGAYFSWAMFTEGEFIGTAFKKGASFDYAEFRERVSFRPGCSMEEEKKLSVLLGHGSSFQYTRFLGEAVFQDVNLSNCSFLHSNIDRVDFRYCTFNEEEGLFSFFSRPRQNVLRDELEADEVVGKGGSGEDATFWGRLLRPFGPRNDRLREERYEPVRRLYLELKRNFEDKKDWNTAGDFHYGEMECRRKGRLGGWLDFLLVTTYYGASGYGERPWRALLWWFFSTLLFFPLLYRLSEHDPLSACVWDSVRVATFMKIGIPIEPEGWGKLVLALQYFIGPTLLALFGLALRRKVKR